jgi:hypothetical protein
MKQFLLAVALAIGLWACNSVYTSKKTGYFHIELPEHSYQQFDREGFPYKFEYPVYADVVQDTTYFDASPENNYWVNIDFPQFNARVFLSYKEIGGYAPYKVKQEDGSYKDSMGLNRFDMMVNDAFNHPSRIVCLQQIEELPVFTFEWEEMLPHHVNFL